MKRTIVITPGLLASALSAHAAPVKKHPRVVTSRPLAFMSTRPSSGFGGHSLAEIVVKKHRKYLAIVPLLILVGLGAYYFKDNVIPMCLLFVWVLIVATVFAIAEKIIGVLFASRTS